MAAITVGVRELRSRLSQYLRRIARGDQIVVTDRGRPVAVMAPAAEHDRRGQIEAMLRDGTARWEGGKPRGRARPRPLTGPPVADAVIEDRR